MISLRPLTRDTAGSAAIEFALIAPVFLMMLLGVFQVGIWLQSYNAMRGAVADTARQVAVEYQTANKLTNAQISNTGLAVATTSPYLLKESRIEVNVDEPTAQTFAGARELNLTLTYQLPTFLDFAGISGPSLTYSRAMFVTEE
ncbi:TadE/TadG family type IV pilus assembly protein [Parafrankia sp. BMG5.11]|uniref:TadE/TadG family type IV pilus assembly protein n=1 Tax=Parafrankia sp. BMG5.11 TaxID=222540 RepID=UPI0010408061|nr:TadE/TadG family type IV pilus assembly protein [Parafrankia sp. BMG5.11]TCJ39217.1 pilus assembly protein [Parafrankia sp. BMG5.11]